MAFSCRERAADHLQKADDLAREAVTAAIYLHNYDDTKRAAVAGAAQLLRRKVG